MVSPSRNAKAFLRAILTRPKDDACSLVYADFLQEQGEEDRAELIRVQCERVVKIDTERLLVLQSAR